MQTTRKKDKRSWTTIAVSRTVHDRLRERKYRSRKPYSDVIEKLLDETSGD